MLNLAMVYDGPHSTAIDQQIIAASPIALVLRYTRKIEEIMRRL